MITCIFRRISGHISGTMKTRTCVRNHYWPARQFYSTDQGKRPN